MIRRPGTKALDGDPRWLEIPVVRRLGPYELVRRLSDGAIGERWLAQRTGPNGPALFILEILHGRALAIPEVRGRAFDEARRSIALRHPNIVSVLEVVELEGAWVVVMSGSEGMSLADFVGQVHGAGQRLTYALVAFVIGELLRGLAHAHELVLDGRPAGMLHGAITPRDVWLSTDGGVSLMGFGLSRIGVELTRTPAAMRYMPPEQLTGGRGPSLDMYAIGGLLHELLDGREFRIQAADDATLYAAIRDGQIAVLGPQHPDYPVPLESLRAGLLAHRSEFRIPSARDAYALLGEWPGYRDASSELAGLVRGYLGLPDPNAGPAARGPGNHSTVIIDPSMLEPTPAPRHEPEPEPVQLVNGLPPSDPTSGKSKPAASTIALIAGAAALGLGFIIVGLGFALGWWGPRSKSEPEVAQADPAPAVAAPEPVPEPEPEVLPNSEPVPELDPVAQPVETDPGVPLPGAEQTPEANPSSGTGRSTGTTSSGHSSGTGKTSKKKPGGLALGVSVNFVEKLPGSIELKAGSKVIEFDGSKAVILQPGSYAVSVRKPGDKTWRSAGKIKVELNKRYEVTIADPPKAIVKTL